MFFVFTVALIYLLYSKKITLKKSVICLSIFLIISVATGGWWTFYESSSPINNLMAKASSIPGGDEGIGGINYTERIMDRLENRFDNVIRRTFGFMWSAFGWHVIFVSPIYVQIASAFATVSIIGMVVSVFRKSYNIKKGDLLLLSFIVIFMMSAMAFYTLSSENMSGDSRYMFVGISAFGILFTWGFSSFFKNHKKQIFLLFIPLIFLLMLNLHVISLMDENFAHGFGGEKYRECLTASKYDQIRDLLIEYCNRGDLAKAFPEVYEGDLERLINWGYNFGFKENESLLGEHKPFYLMMMVYIQDLQLQEKFPESKNGENVEKLIDWVVVNGTRENNSLKSYEDYYKKLLQLN